MFHQLSNKPNSHERQQFSHVKIILAQGPFNNGPNVSFTEFFVVVLKMISASEHDYPRILRGFLKKITDLIKSKVIII